MSVTVVLNPLLQSLCRGGNYDGANLEIYEDPSARGVIYDPLQSL